MRSFVIAVLLAVVSFLANIAVKVAEAATGAQASLGGGVPMSPVAAASLRAHNNLLALLDSVSETQQHVETEKAQHQLAMQMHQALASTAFGRLRDLEVYGANLDAVFSTLQQFIAPQPETQAIPLGPAGSTGGPGTLVPSAEPTIEPSQPTESVPVAAPDPAPSGSSEPPAA